jgi:hypothetical protein
MQPCHPRTIGDFPDEWTGLTGSTPPVARLDRGGSRSPPDEQVIDVVRSFRRDGGPDRTFPDRE